MQLKPEHGYSLMQSWLELKLNLCGFENGKLEKIKNRKTGFVYFKKN